MNHVNFAIVHGVHHQTRKDYSFVLQRLSRKQPGVEAVFLTGSIGRGDCNPEPYGYSVDLTVLISCKSIDHLFDSFETSKEGRFLYLSYNSIPFTIERLALEFVYPYNSDASSKYYALQEAIILYDKSGLAEKVQSMKMPEKDWRVAVSHTYYQALIRLNNYRLEKWFRRKEFRQCHLNLNDGLKLIMELIYLVNRSFVPRDDYLFYLLDSLPWLPSNAEQKFSEAIFVREMTVEDVLRRRRQLVSILFDIKEKVNLKAIDPFDHTDSLEKVRRILAIPKLQKHSRIMFRTV